ncbi:uncharacterized protein EV422DRAFT_572424 [Fimicolochytrium jonesii]|uniref:uncharacterized protein n=1 Tax=Fimicolochytrium jonesii TaxID=1396493 RepID=UPI0022FE4252|nr:uncharacterized protein EV422DRAFT_572424 [Fimicolochytrium jonesii]KAI8815838.1 hypothetical protein EV422DRAFT_572424 [Fimicolochytrium jonesii]
MSRLSPELLLQIVLLCDGATFISALCVSDLYQLLTPRDLTKRFAHKAKLGAVKSLSIVPEEHLLVFVDEWTRVNHLEISPNSEHLGVALALIGRVDAFSLMSTRGFQIDLGRDPDDGVSFRHTLADIAVVREHVDLFKHLTDFYPPSLVHINRLLYCVCEQNGDLDMIRHLHEECGADLLQQDGPIWVARVAGHRDAIMYILDRGGNMSEAFNQCCGRGHLALVEELMSMGAEVVPEALANAVGWEQIEIATLLLTTDVDVESSEVQNALQWAKETRRTEIVALFAIDDAERNLATQRDQVSR